MKTSARTSLSRHVVLAHAPWEHALRKLLLELLRRTLERGQERRENLSFESSVDPSHLI